jgi:hypothetical protein
MHNGDTEINVCSSSQPQAAPRMQLLSLMYSFILAFHRRLLGKGRPQAQGTERANDALVAVLAHLCVTAVSKLPEEHSVGVHTRRELATNFVTSSQAQRQALVAIYIQAQHNF